MTDYREDFVDFEETIWVNAASEGPLPRVAAKALEEAVVWKSSPNLLDDEKFARVPSECKKSIAKLLDVEKRDVILANSASYGVHLLANGFKWEKGDEVLLMQDDFPTNILPWLALKDQGVIVKQIKPAQHVLTLDEIEQNISQKTRFVCLSHVHTFSGYTIDVQAIGELCRSKGIYFVLNISQSVGNQPLSISSWPVDAIVTAGYKWLCGPYGTGFAWMTEELRSRLNVNNAYWIPYLSLEEKQSWGPLEYKEQKFARQLDVFGTANFFNIVPFKAAIDFWLGIGLEKVQMVNEQLVHQFINECNHDYYTIISPTEDEHLSPIIVISAHDPAHNIDIFQQCKNHNIHPAFWKGNIRFAPHVYNTKDQISHICSTLSSIHP